MNTSVCPRSNLFLNVRDVFKGTLPAKERSISLQDAYNKPRGNSKRKTVYFKNLPVSSSSPNKIINTFALVPAPLTSPVTTDTSYVFMRAVEHLEKKKSTI